MLAALCVAMLPWWIRNAYVTGRFVPTTLQIGASLYDGLSPSATGASDMEFVPTFVAQERQRDVWATEGGGALFEVRLDRRMRDESVTWAADNPARVRATGVDQGVSHVECVAERATSIELAHPSGGGFHVYPVGDFCDNRRLENARPRVAVHTVLAACGVLHVAAHGVRQLDSLSGAGDVGIAGAVGRSDDELDTRTRSGADVSGRRLESSPILPTTEGCSYSRASRQLLLVRL